ncbi:MAG: 5-methylcytosine-specific restriction enzyme subunit McrC [Chitinophagaceae bacterium]|nr:5-methylcytosine-specific restriction enzyme subunit McrC [Chitinophagaceae bacterium]
MAEIAAHFLARKIFYEHQSYFDRDYRLPEGIIFPVPPPIYFMGDPKSVCFGVGVDGQIENSYYIGADWIKPDLAVYVEAKINRKGEQLNLLRMLFEAIKHPEIMEHVEGLYEIKWDSPVIRIRQQQDMLTPLLILQFLQMVKRIVRKGLKKSYYTVVNEFNGKIKGKLNLAETIRRNISKGRITKTSCTYQEFGFNCTENKILKKALHFVQRYLAAHPYLNAGIAFTPLFNYILPAFDQVDEDVDIRESRSVTFNPFYREYQSAIRLALDIIKRFGYNLNNTVAEEPTVPPFWIDMSKLFELYVLGLLRDNYGKEILYGKREAKGNYGLPDFLLTLKDQEMIIDAKYKLLYNKLPKTESEEDEVHSRYAIDNIRQLSAYARDAKINHRLGLFENKITPCLIIYPHEQLGEQPAIDLTAKKKIGQFLEFYKLPVKLPRIISQNK